MTELLHAGMVIPASIGVCCSVGTGAWSTPATGSAGRRRVVLAGAMGRVLAVVAALLMLGAMVDMAFFAGSVPGWAGRSIAWAAAMVAGAIVVVLTARAAGGVTQLDLHRALGLVVTAALVVALHAGAPDLGVTASSAHGGHATTSSAPVIVAGAVAFAVYSAWHAVRAHRVGSRVRALDAAAMAGMTLAMLVVSIPLG